MAQAPRKKTITLTEGQAANRKGQTSAHMTQSDQVVVLPPPELDANTLAQVTELVRANPDLFIQFERAMKGKDKAEGSGKRLEHPHRESSSDGGSNDRNLKRRKSPTPNKDGERTMSIAYSAREYGQDAREPKRIIPEESSRLGGRRHFFSTKQPYSPFSEHINDEPLPSNFKLPSIPMYDGKGDLEDHLHMFLNAFRLYQIPDSAMC